DFAERVYRAGRAWNWALDLTIARASNRAIRDMSVQFIADVIDIGLSVSSSGTWTVFRLLLAGIDVGFKANSQRLIGTDLRNQLDALGTERLSEAIKA